MFSQRDVISNKLIELRGTVQDVVNIKDNNLITNISA